MSQHSRVVTFVLLNPGCKSGQVQAGLGLSHNQTTQRLFSLWQARQIDRSGIEGDYRYWGRGAMPAAESR